MPAKNKTIHPMEAVLKLNRPPKLSKGQEQNATIVSLSKKGVTFDIGAKAHAVLGDLEVKEISTYLPYLKEGSKIKVRIVAPESKEGYPVVSMRKFFQKGKWEILKEK